MAAWLRNCAGKHRHKPAAPPSLWSGLAGEISHFLAVLIILVLINLAPTVAQGKVMRFTDSKGVIHITSASQDQGEKAKKSWGKAPPAGSVNLNRCPGPEPATAMTPPPKDPQAEPSPGTDRKGPPPELGAAGPDAQLQASQSQPRGNADSLELTQGTMPESVPYTAKGDPFLNPSMPVMPVAAGLPPEVKISRAAAVQEEGIRSFKDHHGVIHITNQGSSSESGGRQWAVAGPRPAFPVAADSPPAIRPISWQPDAPQEPAGIGRVGRVVSHLAREPVIHRFRDHQGVWHITNVAPAGRGLPAASLAARKGEPRTPGVVRAATVQSSINYPWLRGAEKFGAGPLAGQKSVRSHRDRRGTIHICNAPAQEAGKILASMAYLKKTLGPIIAEATSTYRLPPALVLAVIQAESNFVPHAVSPKGALGLMQLMPGTANLLGVQNPFNPRENILAGCRYLRDLLDRFKGSLPLAVAAYNAGDSRVVAAGYMIPAIKETRDFVASVLELYYLIENGRGGL
jgi:soluble lytic murein transglycosylase-like protein